MTFKHHLFHRRGPQLLLANVKNAYGRIGIFLIKDAPGETPLNKAILLSSVFLIDFVFWESDGGDGGGGG